MTIRILLADDQALLRQSLRMMLSAEDDRVVIGEAGDGVGFGVGNSAVSSY